MKSLEALEELNTLISFDMSILWGDEQKEWNETIKKELKALEILIKWYQPDIIHDLCCFGASDEEINLLKEIIYECRTDD